ncbi:hypothetical protein [Cellvibrio sp. PSBB006]|uniref:hypothetical protein n=1 Tax=Cellvibrio sp. PSBB006 TaxID=1987723 RepID=UPI0018DFF7FC|nr:hypothetical protein [Cellvibrio sp. PSBB006]
MTNSPYLPPQATLTTPTNSNAVPTLLYSPTQAACGTIGGPVGLVYFLWKNFRSLNNESAAKKTVLYGGFFIIALTALIPFLPENIPNTIFTIAYIITARHVAEKHQMSKQAIKDSPLHDFQSNWRVLGVGLLCLIASAIIIIGPLLLLAMIGVWNP